MSTDERTFEPTPRRRQRAKEAGDVARSPILTGAVVWVTGLEVLRATAPWASRWLAELGQDQWTYSKGSLDASVLVAQLQHWLVVGLTLVLPVGVAVLLGVVLVNVLQSGWLWTPGRITLQPQRIGVAAAWNRWCDGETMRAAVRELAMVMAGVAVLAWRIRSGFPTLFGLADQSGGLSASELLQFVFDTGRWAGAAWLVIGLVDYAWSWRRLERRLHLTPQEAREEAQDDQRADAHRR